MLDIPVLISGGGPVGLSASLLLSQGVPMIAHGDELGRTYANELDRHFRSARPVQTA